MDIPNFTDYIPGPWTLIIGTLFFVAVIVGGPFLLAWIIELLAQE